MRDTSNRGNDEIAIVGYAARLPGADTVEQVWETLIEGRCEVGPIPGDRWSSIRYFDPNRDIPGRSYANAAGLLGNVYDFDAGYFGLTPREAEQMDPQQRVLLEAVASAFDNAGIDPAKLDKERTGVFVGAASSDHSTSCLQDPTMMDAQYMLGNTLSIISNRISYHWDLRGPSYTVDTACSSGLFALDQARRAIETGEIDTAVVGSVNMLLSPMPFIGFSKASMLSATGLCQAFSKNADGYVRAEGAVVFILRSASLARTSHDRIRSYVVASGTNSDGRTPGIAMPSSIRQHELLESIKWRFDISPDDLAFVEAHGTGTPVGDPEEARAIGKSYGQGRGSLLPIGSAKTNFGHLEPAAGLVGLLKAQLALEKGKLPASLHASELNPDIPFEDLGLEVVREPRDLPGRGKPWLAAVNSFGFGGANAHAVLQQADTVKDPKADLPKALVLSAESEQSLRALAKAWRDRAADPAPDFAVSVVNANSRLARHRLRLAVPSATPVRMKNALDGWLDGEKSKSTVQGAARSGAGKIGFVFSGNGSQWAGMGRYMLLRDATFRDSFGESSAIAADLGSESLLDLIMSTDLETRLDRAPVAQPLLLAIQVGLVDALAAQGVKPDAVLGHSAGEVAAAYACGAITREDALRIIVARSETLDHLFNSGTMAALSCDEAQAAEIIASAGLDVDIAAENSAGSITVSGTSEDVAHLLKICRTRRIAGRRLQIDYPYHSRLTEPLRDRLIDELTGISGSDTKVPFYSGCLGYACPGSHLDKEFWWQNARNKVQFRACVEAMARDGISVFLELSPKSVLQAYVRDSLEESGQGGTVLGSLEQTDADQIDAVTIALNVLAHGGRIDEHVLLGDPVPFAANLPNYPFDRKTHRMGSDRQFDLWGRKAHHDLLGSRLDPDSNVWTSELSLSRLPWLADHKVDGRVLVPATGILEMLLSAAREVSGEGAIELRNLEILRPIQLADKSAVPVKVSHDAVARRLTIEIRQGGEWVWVAGAALFHLEAEPNDAPSVAKGDDTTALYPALVQQGLDYGPAFARAERISLTENAADVILSPAKIDTTQFALDPTGSDAVLHAALPLIARHQPGVRRLFVPGRMGRVRQFRAGAPDRAQLRLVSASTAGVCIEVTYLDGAGQVLAEIDDLWLRPMLAGREKRTLFWDEHEIPVARRGGAVPKAMAEARARDAETAPSDLEVLRDTIGARLAWDILSGSGDPSALDRRHDAAHSALDALDLIEMDGKGRSVLVGECPWPDMQTLLKLLTETEPDAVDEIQATLHGMVTDRKNEAAGVVRLREAALELLAESSDRLGRVLMTGRIDPAVFRFLLAHAGLLVVAVENADDVEALHLSLDGTERCHVTTIEDAFALPLFDLTVGIGVAQAFSPRTQKRIAEFAALGNDILLLDHAVDLFELMTGRYADDYEIGILDGHLESCGFSVDRKLWDRAAQVTYVAAEASRRENKATPQAPAVAIHGTGPLADALRAVEQEGEVGTAVLVVNEPAEDLLRTALSQSEVLRNLPEAATVWLLQDGLDGAAALVGWRRVLTNETGRDIRAASVAPGTDPTDVLRSVASSRERELTLTVEGPRATRIVPALGERLTVSKGQKAVLSQSSYGRLDTLHWTAAPRQAPGAGEIEIEITSTALNFRDVMWAQGLLPSDLLNGGFAGPTLGMECAGTVSRVGKNSGFRKGDRVLAFSPDAFATHVTVPAIAAVGVPPDLDLTLAAAIPVIFVTAEYALTDLARLREDDWVLIHGGAGGVGLAAIQVARRAGARIIATAGSDTKRSLLRSLGVEHVCDSRSLEFCEYVDRVTEGRGVDVVLNSLAGEAMEQGIGCLAPFGRFIELGKRDYVANTAIGLRALKNNISYFAVDADQLLKHRPELAGDIMRRIVDAFTSGEYTVPPVRRYPSEMAGDAFRLMQKSGHIGKILITPPSLDATIKSKPEDLAGRWLVSGGTRGFGLATADWLADQGATSLWLVSRGGAIADPNFAARMSARGVRVETRGVDLTDETAVAALMTEIEEAEGGLDGIVNGAAVFDDAMFADTDAARLARVLTPKLGSALALDRASRRFDLRHFWLYSSVAARFGNPGQSAYVAANLELEALARRRAVEGLPALAIAWGPIGDAGYLGNAGELKSVIERKLGRMMTSTEAFGELRRALERDPARPTLTIAPVDWARLKADVAVVSEPLFECLDIRTDASGDDGVIDLAALVTQKGEAKARKMLLEVLQREAAQIMRIAPNEIDVNRELMELGFDSLMGMSLKLAMEERLGTATPLTSIADGMTLSRLAHTIVSSVGTDGPETEADSMADRHLTDSDMPVELRQKIANAAAR